MPGSLLPDVEAAGKSNRIPAQRVSVYLAREIRKFYFSFAHHISRGELQTLCHIHSMHFTERIYRYVTSH